MEETVAVETSASKTSFIQLPQDIAGKRYSLKTTASYDDSKAFSTFGFNVISVETVKQECVENWQCTEWQPIVCPSSQQQSRSCDDLNICGTVSYKPQTSRTCVYQEAAAVETPPQTSSLTVWERLDLTKEKAKTNPSEAESECAGFAVESHRDECYYNIAEVTLSLSFCNNIVSDRTREKCTNSIAKLTENSALCEQIVTSTRKDSCYMNFVNRGDYTVCDKIENPYLKDACDALKSMPDIVVS